LNGWAALPTRKRYLVPLVLLAATFVYLFRLGATPLRINAEIRCHSIVANMLSSGDYLMPRIDTRELFGAADAIYEGEHLERVNKPPLFYWTASLSAKALGGLNLATFRFPAVVAAIGLLVVGFAWARRLGTGLAGVAAISLLAVCYDFVVHARRGSFEMMLSFFAGAGLYALWGAAERRSWRAGLAAGLCFALAFLTKGTPALLVMVAPAAVWLLMQGRWRDIFRWRVLAVAAAALLLALSWYLAIAVTSRPGRDRLVAEFLLPFGVRTLDDKSALHRGPVYMYAKAIWSSLFPLSLFLPLTAWHVWRERFFRPGSPWRLLVCAVVVPFAVFSLLPQKRNDYMLPTAMPMALLTGRALDWGARSLAGRWRALFSMPQYLVGAAFLLLAPVVAFALRIVCDVNPAACVLYGTGQAAAGVVLLASAWRARHAAALGAGLAGFALVWLAYFGMIRPVEDAFGSGRIFADPSFDKAAWDAKFERYRIGKFDYLYRLLDVEHGLRRYNDGKV
jgi:4-amino-4-deoxy-L-arabinose transferase-like glycosyltransferase